MRPLGQCCNPDRVKLLNRELNMLRNERPAQVYGFAYILWLQCGAVGPAPEKPKRLTYKRMAEIKAMIDAQNLWAD